MSIGMLTPSSNTVLEPIMAARLADLPGASAHFSRFRVVAIDLGAASREQFDPAPVAAAAELLADARVEAICWNGTSGAWLGLDVDRALCGAVTARTGVPAATAPSALFEALGRLGARALRAGDALPRRRAGGHRRALGGHRAGVRGGWERGATGASLGSGLRPLTLCRIPGSTR